MVDLPRPVQSRARSRTARRGQIHHVHVYIADFTSEFASAAWQPQCTLVHLAWQPPLPIAHVNGSTTSALSPPTLTVIS